MKFFQNINLILLIRGGTDKATLKGKGTMSGAQTGVHRVTNSSAAGGHSDIRHK